MSGLILDLRVAVRGLRRRPVFVVLVVMSVAIGIASTSTIFSLVNALFLRPLPGVTGQDRLVNVHRARRGRDGFGGFSYPAFREVREGSDVFEGLAAFTDHGFSLRADGRAQLIVGQLVSANYFAVLGTRPALGRLFTRDEALPGRGDAVAVISHGLWQRRFGGDPAVIGRTVRLSGHPFTVVGVAPAGFTGTFVGFPFDVWVPLGTAPRVAPRESLTSRDRAWLEVVGRLEPGVSREQALGRLESLARRLERVDPETWRDTGFKLHPTSGLDDSLRDGIASFVGILAGVAGLLLLIACMNAGGMLLVRGSGRRRELAVRAALGSSRWRIGRLILAETLVLFLAGGAVGLVLAAWTTGLLEAFNPPFAVPLALELSPDGRVWVFGLASTAVAAGIFGLLPALGSSRPDPVGPLRGAARSVTARGSWLRNGFVTAQVALSVLVLVVAGLFVRTLQEAADVDPGFDVRNLQVADITLSILDLDDAEGRRFYDRLLERVRAFPDVAGAAVAARMPLSLGRSTTVVAIADAPMDRGHEVGFNVVSAGYFETMRIPLVAGRPFDATDRSDGPGLAIVNQTLADRLWPGLDPLGRRIVRDGVELEVVGVAADGKYHRPWESHEPHLYLAFSQHYRARTDLIVRASLGPGLLQAIRRVTTELEPDLPVPALTPAADLIGISMLPQRIGARIASLLGLIGLALAGLGIYGVVALRVTQRRREIGIRMAVGGRARDMLRLFLGQGLKLALLGLVPGIAAALLFGRLLSAFLFGIRSTDPLTFTAVSVLLVSAALLASYVPARRAARVDPTDVLRES